MIALKNKLPRADTLAMSQQANMRAQFVLAALLIVAIGIFRPELRSIRVVSGWRLVVLSQVF